MLEFSGSLPLPLLLAHRLQAVPGLVNRPTSEEVENHLLHRQVLPLFVQQRPKVVLQARDAGRALKAALFLVMRGGNAVAQRGVVRKRIAVSLLRQFAGEICDRLGKTFLILAHAGDAMVELALLLHQLVEILQHGEHRADFVRLRPLRAAGKPGRGECLGPFLFPAGDGGLGGGENRLPAFQGFGGAAKLRGSRAMGRRGALRMGGDPFCDREEFIETIRQIIRHAEPHQFVPQRECRRLFLRKRSVARLARCTQIGAQHQRCGSDGKPSFQLRHQLHVG
ncbi:hypothetical protein ABIA24_002582 [Sinorhizobium fredii]